MGLSSFIRLMPSILERAGGGYCLFVSNKLAEVTYVFYCYNYLIEGMSLTGNANKYSFSFHYN